MNLPYILDGDRVISQSNSCAAYLGRKFGMLGSTEDELIKCEEFLCEVMDVRNNMVKFAYGPACNAETAAACIKAMWNSLNKIELHLMAKVAAGDSSTFLVGESATAPDFFLYEMLLQGTVLAETEKLPSPLTEVCDKIGLLVCNIMALDMYGNFMINVWGTVLYLIV